MTMIFSRVKLLPGEAVGNLTWVVDHVVSCCFLVRLCVAAVHEVLIMYLQS